MQITIAFAKFVFISKIEMLLIARPTHANVTSCGFMNLNLMVVMAKSSKLN
jgi:hypothetical protein